MTTAEFLARARSQLKFELSYRLGAGKIVPSGEHCGDETMGCDCSAFVCWCARMRKYQGEELWWLSKHNGGWLNTDGIWIDAVKHTSGNFEPASRKPGAVVVYPGASIEEAFGSSRWGHVGIVTAIDEDKLTVIHCSSGNYKKTGRAVMETDGELFTRRKAIFCWPASVEPSGEKTNG